MKDGPWLWDEGGGVPGREPVKPPLDVLSGFHIKIDVMAIPLDRATEVNESSKKKATWPDHEGDVVELPNHRQELLLCSLTPVLPFGQHG